MRPGDKIGRYVVEALLGEGGMGHVYRAYDATLHRRVAIKLLRTDLIEDEAAPPTVARIVREARMAAALEHPNVVSIFDVGEHAGTPFIVMELVTGHSLRAFVGHGDVHAAERVRWMVDVARALAAAHKAGLVHRDVKPENVLVREDGVVKVLDFGIARLERSPSMRPPPLEEGAAPPSIRTTVGLAATVEKSTLAGTPAYMAPEQIRRERVDARADQFAWGVVAYELLAGKLPWGQPGANVSLLMSVLNESPEPLDAEALEIPYGFAAAVMRALAKRPEERFPSMDDLVHSLGFSTIDVSRPSMPGSGQRMSLPSPSSSGALPRANVSAVTELATKSAGSLAAAANAAVAASPPRAWRRRGAAVALLVVAAAAMGGLAVVKMRRAATPPAPPLAASHVPSFQPHDARRLTFEQGCEEYPSLTPDGNLAVFDSSVGDDTQIVALDIPSGTQRRITTEAGWHYAPVVSPDGTRVAYVRQAGDEVGTWIAPLDGSSPPSLFAKGRMRPSWTPDGRALWAGPADAPARIDLASGQVTRTLDAPTGYFLVRLRELDDGRVIARLLDRETKRGRGLVLYPKQGGAPSPLFPDNTEDALLVAPHGGAVLVPKLLSNEKVELWQVPLDGGEPSRVPSNAVLPTKGIEVSKDGREVVWSTCSTEQDVAALRAGEDGGALAAVPLLPKSEWTDEQPAAIPGSPNGLVVVSDRSAKRELWVIDVAGKEPARKLPLGPFEAASPTVSPDGRWVAFTALGEGIAIVPLDGAAEARLVTQGKDDTGASFSRDGAWIFFSSPPQGIARVRPDGSGRELVLADSDRPSASPENDQLAYVALSGDTGTPMILDLATRRSRPLSPALRDGSYGGLRFSGDGKRVVVSVGLTAAAEVDAASGAVLRRFDSGDQLTSVTYVGREVVVSRIAWRGDLWAARDPWRD